MAEAKVQISLGTRADVSGVNATSNAFKKLAKDNKDAIGGLTLSVKALASSVDGPLGGAIGGMSSILAEIVRGGLWGALGAVANMAVGKVIELWKEAKARAEEYANFMRAQVVEAMTGVEAKVKSLSAAVADADKDVDAFIKSANGNITAQAKYDIARLHVEALQQVTDGMTEAAKGVIAANEAYEAGIIKAQAEVDSAVVAYKAYRDRQEAVRAQVSQAEENLAAAVAEKARLEEMNHDVVYEHCVLVAKANQTVEDMVNEGWNYIAAVKEQTKNVHMLNEFEKTHKDRLEQMKKAEESVTNARNAVSTALKAQEEIGKKLEKAGEQEVLARKNLEATELELAEKNRIAASIRQKEIDAAAAKAEADEIAAIESERQLEWQEKIYKTIKNDTEMRGELINRLNELMADGCEDEEIAHELNEKMREVRERRLKAEEDLAKDAEDEHKGEDDGRKSSKDDIRAHSSMSVSLDDKSTTEGASKIDKKANFREWKHQQRVEARKMRDEKGNIKQDFTAMTKYLKRDMDPIEDKKFKEYLAGKYTKEQMTELANCARKGQLMSAQSKEWFRQKDKWKEALDAIKKASQESAKSIKDALAVK